MPIAALLMVCQACLFAADTALIHYLARWLPVPLLAALRGLGGLGLAALIARDRALFYSQQPKIQVARGIAALAYSIVQAFSFALLPFAAATAISYTASLYITLFSAVLLGENVGLKEWLAVGLGFAGALVVAQPGFTWSWWYLVALAGTAFNGVQFVLNRKLNRTDAQATTLAWMNASIILGNSAAMLFTPSASSAFSSDNLGLIALFLIIGPFGTYAGLLALTRAEAAKLAPYTLGRIVVSTPIAALVFGEALSSTNYLGIMLIVTSCILPIVFADIKKEPSS